jgi:TPR repeat protein
VEAAVFLGAHHCHGSATISATTTTRNNCSVDCHGRNGSHGNRNNEGAELQTGLPGIKKDPVLGVGLLRAAAEKGDPTGMLQLGLCFALGVGVPASKVEAVGWLTPAAEAGLSSAQYNLGCLLDTGGEHAIDGPAGKWYRAAADQGHPDALFNLGCLAARADGDVWMAAAVRYFEQAAALGHAAAAVNLDLLLAAESSAVDEIAAI